MYTTNITTGNTEIVSSGNIIAFLEHPIFVEVQLDTFLLKICFVLIDDKNIKSSFMDTSIVDDTLYVHVYNFNSPLGTGIEQPIEFGTDSNKLLYLNFRIYHIEKSSKMLIYNIYRDFNEVHE